MFEISEFDLFSREKWSDMVYNKDRLRVKQKLITIGKQVITTLGESGAALQMETGSEYPAIWNKRKVDRLELVFIRPVEERKLLSKAFSREIPMAVSVQNPSDIYMNISLGLFIDKDGIKVGIQIPWLAFADRETFNTIISDTDQYSELIDLINNGGSEISFVSPSTAIPCSEISTEILKNSLEQLSSGTTDDYRVSLGFFKIYSITDCSSENIFNDITHVLSNLISLYKFLSWNSSRDRIGVKGLIVQIEKTLQKEKEDRELEERKKQELKIQASKSNEKADIKPTGKPAVKPTERPNSRPQNSDSRPSRPKSNEGRQQKPQAQTENKKKTPKQPKNPFSVGDSVIIKDGLLMGKKGKITSISGNK